MQAQNAAQGRGLGLPRRVGRRSLPRRKILRPGRGVNTAGRRAVGQSSQLAEGDGPWAHRRREGVGWRGAGRGGAGQVIKVAVQATRMPRRRSSIAARMLGRLADDLHPEAFMVSRNNPREMQNEWLSNRGKCLGRDESAAHEQPSRTPSSEAKAALDPVRLRRRPTSEQAHWQSQYRLYK